MSIVYSDEEQKIVGEGTAAAALLDNPIFLTAIEAIRAQCAEAILTSLPADVQGREDAYSLSRALSAVTAELGALASAAEAVEAQAQANTEYDVQPEADDETDY